MKKIILLFTLVTLSFAQTVKVESVKQIQTGDKRYYFAKFNPNGKSIIFSKDGYKGLYSYDLSEKSITELNDHSGAGYEPTFSNDGKTIYFRSDNFVNGKRFSSLISQDVETKSEKVILKDQRNLLPPKLNKNGNISFILNNEANVIQQNSLKKSSNQIITQVSNELTVHIDNTKISLSQNGTTKILDPIGNGNYIWPSISPNGEKLLFTDVRSGTYISDLDGNILVKLGYANAPKWSPDGNWICYMVDKDDGHRFTGSEIFVISSDGENRFKLTNTNDQIEMYPSWSPDSKKLVYHSNSGNIFLINLKINK
ncbi:MAG: hypothetical protein U9R41_04540 [Candidatus Marinimicrobia bacterium]|nr:hypothetical protein [Candidatus Neomarinimicrobiota bacterium]